MKDNEQGLKDLAWLRTGVVKSGRGRVGRNSRSLDSLVEATQ